MRSEEAGVWIVLANKGEETAILVKAPTPTLKAILSGASAGIVCGVHAGFLCTGLRVHDVPEAPLALCGVQRHEEEHFALRRILTERRSQLFLFNELDVCVSWANITIADADAIAGVVFLDHTAPHYTGEFNAAASLALDCFIHSLDPTQVYPNVVAIPVLETPVNNDSWTTAAISFHGIRERHTIRLDDRDEGQVLERVVWAALESVFPTTLYKSPMLHKGSKLRELTDILAFHEYGSIFFEAKDLSIFQAGLQRKRYRRAKGIQHQARKAIQQLVGASKAAKRGEEIVDSKGNPIRLIVDQPFHCVVLITELMHEGDWSEVEQDLRAAMIETHDFFQILDLRELIVLLKISRGQAARFDYNLMERSKRFVGLGTVHMRSRPAPDSFQR